MKEHTISARESELMADDVQKLQDQIEQCYRADGVEPPPPLRIMIQAQCAWTLMAIRGQFEVFKEASINARAAQAKKPSIILPTGVRPIR